MIGVGIHENLVLSSKTALGAQGGFNLIFAKKQVGSLYQALVSNESVAAEEVMLKMFTINAKRQDGTVKTPVDIAQEFGNLREQFCDILLTATPAQQVNDALDMAKIFQSVGITAANESQLSSKFQDDTFTAALFNSLCSAFVNVARPMMDNAMMRLKLRRRSTDSHYPSIPFKGKFPEVWVESMQIPTESSQIAFSQWEIDNEINDGTPVKADAAPSTAQAEAAFSGPSAPGVVAAPVNLPVAGVEAAPVAAPAQVVAPATPVQPGVQPVTPVEAAVQPVAAQPIAAQPAAVAQPVAQPVAQAAAPVTPTAGTIPVPGAQQPVQ